MIAALLVVFIASARTFGDWWLIPVMVALVAVIAVAIAALWSMAGPNAFDWHSDFRWNRYAMHGLAAVFGAMHLMRGVLS